MGLAGIGVSEKSGKALEQLAESGWYGLLYCSVGSPGRKRRLAFSQQERWELGLRSDGTCWILRGHGGPYSL